MPKKSELENCPSWFDLKKYRSNLSIDEWLNELMVRWELLNGGINPYGYESAWESIQKNGYYKLSENSTLINKSPLKLFAPNENDNIGLLNTHIGCLRFFELCLLIQSLQEDIEKLDLNHAGFINVKDKDYYPDLNITINKMLAETDESWLSGVRRVVPREDLIKQFQFLRINLNTTDDELISQFKIWLKNAREKSKNQTSSESFKRLSVLNKSLNFNSKTDVNKLKGQADKYQIIPSIDLKIHTQINHLKLSRKNKSIYLQIDESTIKTYTDVLVEKLTNKTILTHLLKLSQ